MFLIISVLFNILLAGTFIGPVEKLVHNKTGIAYKNFAIYVSNTDAKSIYAYNENKLMSIASVNKLYTSVASIHFLGAGYRFKTKVYGNIKNHKVKTLIIKGGADPLFVMEKLWVLVNKLQSLGIKEIDKIILDNTMFQPYRIGKSDRAYDTAITPLSFNFNSVAVNIVSGMSPYVSLSPANKILNIKNKMSFCNYCKTKIILRRIDNDIILKGQINKTKYAVRRIYRNLEQPNLLLIDILKQYLSFLKIKNKNITVNIFASLKKTNELFSVDSRRLEDILIDMNRFSNNFIAELLYRKISEQTGKHNISVISSFIKKYLKNPIFNLSDASGMSVSNKSTAKTVVALLSKVYNDFKIGPPLINSLSVSGKDGTIRGVSNRLYIRAKTGTLSAVKSLAGYVLYKNKTYPFMIVANDKNALKLTNVIESILLKVLKEKVR